MSGKFDKSGCKLLSVIYLICMYYVRIFNTCVSIDFFFFNKNKKNFRWSVIIWILPSVYNFTKCILNNCQETLREKKETKKQNGKKYLIVPREYKTEKNF